jgi:hypothetical protein
MQLPARNLEKRLTEFQIAQDSDEQLLGAIGIRLTPKHGLIHSESYTDYALADTLRMAIWDRLQSVANNHGLVRLWTRETAPFWTHSGFTPATEEELEKLPPEWVDERGDWLTLKLREDVDEVINLDKEFSVFMEAEKQRSQQMMGQARMLKLLATLLAVALFAGIIAVGIWVVMKNPGLLGR